MEKKMLRRVALYSLLLSFSLCAFSQQRKQLQKPLIRIGENLPPSVKALSRAGKEIDMTPRIEVEAGTGNYKLLFRNPDDTTKWAYQVFEPATKMDIVVESTVKIDSNEFVYEYTLESFRSSKQNLASFGIDLDTGIVTGCKVPHTGEWHCYLPTRNRRSLFFSGAFISDRFGNIIDYVLKPGTRLSGFIVKSTAPPGIVNCDSRGRVDPQSLRVIGMDGEMVPDAIFLARPHPREDRLWGRTIGPVRVPATITPAQFLDRLLSMIDESFKEGWIGKEALAHQFHTLVNSAKEQLLKGNTVGGKQTLNTFLQLVETTYQRGEILSEPYGLFKYNTLYLTEKLLE